MSDPVSATLRKLVIERAAHRCEYCLMPDFLVFLTFHIDHVISLKHGGKSTLANLAYSCPVCNSLKGTDIGTTLDEEHSAFVPFFNPRRHRWLDHFSVENGLILPKTPAAEGTVKILRFNDVNRVIERAAMVAVGLYP